MAAQPHDVSGSVPVSGFVEAIQAGKIPTQQEFVQYLSTMDPLQAVLLLAIGLTYMLAGYKMFRVLVTANMAFLGFALGHIVGNWAPSPHNLPFVTGVAGALLLGVLSWPLMKFAVSLMGGLIGAAVGAILWRYLARVAGQETLVPYYGVGAMLGLVTLGMLTFVIFRMTIIIFTSLQGSAMAVAAALSMLLRYERFRPQVEDGLMNNVHLLPLLILVPTIIAIVIQDATGGGRHKESAKGPKK
jgi:hypothetical protein